MLVLPAKPGRSPFPTLGHSVLGNLAARFRQSAMALVVASCAMKPRATMPMKPEVVSGSGRSVPHETAKPVLPAATGEPLQSLRPEAPPTLLPIEGYEPATIRLSRERVTLPLFVVAHGAGGQADWHCNHYEKMLGPAALLCVSGKRMATRDPSRGYYYPNHMELESELLAARTVMLAQHSH